MIVVDSGDLLSVEFRTRHAPYSGWSAISFLPLTPGKMQSTFSVPISALSLSKDHGSSESRGRTDRMPGYWNGPQLMFCQVAHLECVCVGVWLGLSRPENQEMWFSVLAVWPSACHFPSLGLSFLP